MKQKQIRKRICSLILAFVLCAGFFPDMDMTTEAATKSEWLEVTGKGSSTLSANETYKPPTGYKLKYVSGSTQECKHTSKDMGCMEWIFSPSEYEMKNDVYPYSAVPFSVSTVNKTFLEKRAVFHDVNKTTNNVLGDAAELTFKYNFILTDKIHGDPSTGYGKRYKNVSQVASMISVNGAGYRGSYQYVDLDGGAAYAYFSHTFCYCSTTKQYYHAEEKVQEMFCSMNPNKTCAVPYVWSDGSGDITYGHWNHKDPVKNDYTHYIGQFNIVPNSGTVTYNSNGGTYKQDGSGVDGVHKYTSSDGAVCYYKSNSSGNIYRSTTSATAGFSQYKNTIKYNKTGTWDPVNHSTLGLSKTGHHLPDGKEWYADINGKTIYFDQNADVLANMKSYLGLANADGGSVMLFSNWTPNTYTIRYDLNGHAGAAIADTPAVYNTSVLLRKCTETDFLGWAKTKDGANAGTVDYANKASVKNLTSKNGGIVTLYAVWRTGEPEETGEYTIHFEGNGATGGTMEDMTAQLGQQVKLPEKKYERTTEQGESLFKGWTRTLAGTDVEFEDQETVEPLSNTDGEVVTLYAVWDDCPQIEAGDRYFNLWWAQNGKITEAELLRTASAVDTEDHELENRTSEQVASQGLPGSLSLYDYDAAAFTSMTETGTVNVTYQAVDSVGHAVYETVTVHVYDTDPVPLPVTYTRYINRKYYEKPYEEGGLHPNSIWRTDPEYRQTLESALDNLENDTPEAVYTFTPEQVQEAKEYIDEHGFSDTKEEGALQGFFDRFMR